MNPTIDPRSTDRTAARRWTLVVVLLVALATLGAACGASDPELVSGDIDLDNTADGADEGSLFGTIVDNRDDDGSSDERPRDIPEPDAQPAGTDVALGSGGEGSTAPEPADGNTTSTPTPTPTPEPVAPPVITEALEGPFGSGTYSHANVSVVAVETSNIPPVWWGDDDFEFSIYDPEEADGRYLYVSFDIVNDDPNDTVGFRDSAFTLRVGDARPVPARYVSGVTNVSEFAADELLLAFDITAVDFDPAAATIHYADGTVPMDFALQGEAAATSGYPISRPVPEPFTYTDGITSCKAGLTLNTEELIVDVDYPAERVESSFGVADNRAAENARWVVLSGFMEIDLTCGATGLGGNILRDNFRLVIDGRPIEPADAPNAIFSNGGVEEIYLTFQVPVDAEEVVLLLKGSGENAETVLDLGDMPLVTGE